jgi:hypothetical protein
MRRKLRQLAKALEGKTRYTPGEVFQYGEGEYQIALALHEGGSTEYVALTLLDGAVHGAEEGVNLRFSFEHFVMSKEGVAFTADSCLTEAFATDVEEIKRRIRQLDVEQLASFVSGEISKIIEQEPRGWQRIRFWLEAGGFLAGFFLLSAVSSVCPPMKRWIQRKARELT